MAKPTGQVSKIAMMLFEKGMLPNPNLVERIVIDIRAGHIPKMYISCSASDDLPEIVGILVDDPEAFDIIASEPIPKPNWA